jgi:hypothetical protein
MSEARQTGRARGPITCGLPVTRELGARFQPAGTDLRLSIVNKSEREDCVSSGLEDVLLGVKLDLSLAMTFSQSSGRASVASQKLDRRPGYVVQFRLLCW